MFMSLNGCLWVFMSFYECHGYVYGCIWVLMGVNECLWVFVRFYGFLDVKDVYEGLWVSWYLWVLMGVMSVYGYYI